MTTDIDTPSGTQTPPTGDDQSAELGNYPSLDYQSAELGHYPSLDYQSAELGDYDREAVFRFPSADDPQPRSRRLLGMSLYASLLGLLGLAVALRGLMSILSGSAPGWYEPALAGTGLLCVALVVAAFLAIQQRILPWLLLLAAAVPLAGTVAIAATGG